jgi:hypothetical protein
MTDTFASESSSPSRVSPETAQREGDVTGMLAELERKLRELESELTSIGKRRTLGESAPAEEAQARAQEPQASTVPATAPAPQAPAAPQAATPPQAAAPQAAAPQAAAPLPPTPPQSVGRLVDEAVEAGSAETFERVRPSDAQLASLAELRRFRDRLERFARELAAEYDALLGRVMTGLSSAPARSAPAPSATIPSSPTPTPTPAAPPPPAAAAQPAAPAAPSQVAPIPEATAAQSRENAFFEGRVELGVGPFYDIASLGAFEQRLASLPGVGEASVRRFEASHAVVDVRLTAPTALVRELRRAAESDFSVREIASGRILLTFDES